MDAGKWLALAAHYLDLIAILVGTGGGSIFTSMIDLYFVPVYTDPAKQRRQKGLLFLLCWSSSTAASFGMWTVIDAADPWQMRLVVSLVVSVSVYWLYPWVALLAAGLLKKFLGIDLISSWSK